MRTLVGRVAGLVLTVAGCVVVPTLVAPPAQAASTGSGRPTAIALDTNGTSYVAFAAGGTLTRITAGGRRIAPLDLDEPGDVVGLAADSGNRLWVAYGDSVSALSLRGQVLHHWDRRTVDTCADDATHSSHRYGGIAVSPDAVYVASRCSNVVEAYARSGGELLATITVPGGSPARGLVWSRAAQSRPARLYVAVPKTRTVLAYAADRLRTGSAPARKVVVRSPHHGRRPIPSGVTVDRFGNLGVLDTANNAVYLYSTGGGRFSRYRILGHPPTGSDADGHLAQPTAMAQFLREESGLSSNLFIADTGNGRVQRWDSGGGYTFWVKALSEPAGGGGGVDPEPDPDPGVPDDQDPVNTRAPRITADAGPTELTCDSGTWTGGPLSYGYSWRRDGVRRSGVTGSTYPLGPSDDGTELTCTVTATSSRGSTSATSDAYFVGTATVPANSTPPRVIGTPARGESVTCSTGTWTASPQPRYSFVWLRGSVVVADGPGYRIAGVDVGARISCTVIATNQAGSASATSAPVTGTGATGGGGGGGGGGGTACGGAPRVVIAGGASTVGGAQVNLTVVAPVDATAFEVANDPSFTGASSRATSAGCRVPWRLAAPRSDRTAAVVYVRWIGGTSAGEVVRDAVHLDRTAPTVRGASVRFTQRHWYLRVRGADASRITRVIYSQRPAGRGHARSYVRKVRVPSPHAARYVRLVDQFGHQSRWYRAR